MSRKTRKEKVADAARQKFEFTAEDPKWSPAPQGPAGIYPAMGAPVAEVPAPKFDIDDVVGNLKPGSDKQTFSRIKRIYAKHGRVYIDVDPTVVVGEHGGKPLENQVLSVKEAAERAAELNRMACVMTAADYKMIMEIVENTIRACKEAQQQLLAPPEKKIVVPNAGIPSATGT